MGINASLKEFIGEGEDRFRLISTRDMSSDPNTGVIYWKCQTSKNLSPLVHETRIHSALE